MKARFAFFTKRANRKLSLVDEGFHISLLMFQFIWIIYFSASAFKEVRRSTCVDLRMACARYTRL